MDTLWAKFVGIWEETAYRSYLARRGFRTDTGWSFARRAFLECWARPGFHWFWRQWNPGLGFVTFLLYRRLGGNRCRVASTLGTFVLSGIGHNLLVFPWLGWSLTLPVAFLCFGLLVTVGPTMSRVLRQDRWPSLLNIPLNVTLILLGFDVGFRVNCAVAL